MNPRSAICGFKLSHVLIGHVSPVSASPSLPSSVALDSVVGQVSTLLGTLRCSAAVYGPKGALEALQSTTLSVDQELVRARRDSTVKLKPWTAVYV